MASESEIEAHQSPQRAQAHLELSGDIQRYGTISIDYLKLNNTRLIESNLQREFDSLYEQRKDAFRFNPFNRKQTVRDEDVRKVEDLYGEIIHGLSSQAKDITKTAEEIRHPDIETSNWVTQFEIAATEKGQQQVPLVATVARNNDQLMIYMSPSNSENQKIPMIDQGAISLILSLSDESSIEMYNYEHAFKDPIIGSSASSKPVSLRQLEIARQLLQAVTAQIDRQPLESDQLLSQLQYAINDFPEPDDNTAVHIFGDRRDFILETRFNPKNQEEFGEEKEFIQNIEVKSIGGGPVNFLDGWSPIYLGDSVDDEKKHGNVLDWFKKNTQVDLDNPDKSHRTEIQNLLRQVIDPDKNNYWITKTDVRDTRLDKDQQPPLDYTLITILNSFGRGDALVTQQDERGNLSITDYIYVPGDVRSPNVSRMNLGNFHSLFSLREAVRLMDRIGATEGLAVNEAIMHNHREAPEYVLDQNGDVWLTPEGLKQLEERAKKNSDTETVLRLLKSNQHENNGICTTWDEARKRDANKVLEDYGDSATRKRKPNDSQE